MKYEVKFTTRFKKDFKLIKKQNLELEEFYEVLKLLANGVTLPDKYHDHQLIGNYKGTRECHIAPNWLLIYKVYDEILVLELLRTGSHNKLFNM